ncbi:MAG: KR domain-containing protein [Burkholderiales bacterium]|nr:KR domain-containing protein [Burkholderiales bacterium]
MTAQSGSTMAVQISVVTRGACEVLGYETVDPWQAVVHGLCQVTNQEHPQLGCRLIDLPPATDPREPDGALWAELRAADAPPVVAWRGRHRWQLDYHTLSLPPVPARRTAGAPGIRKAGTYVVIGDFTRGLGGIWARALARDPARRLVLIAASVPPAPVPPELIDQCRAGGATLVALEADIDAAGSLRAALDAAAEGGPIDGVFCSTPTTNEHAAAPLSLLQPAHWHYNRRTKIRFLQQLAPAIESHAPAFCCVQASLSSVLGGIGLAPYAAANHWVDAFVAAQAASSAVAWYAVNWDTATGDAADMPSGSHGRGASLAEFALTPDDIWTLTERILALTAPGVVAVSKADLRVRRDQWVHGTPQPRVDSTTRGDGYGRPDLTTAYLAPRNDIERTIADIWQDLLRVDRVGVHDSFFDLGGHSLLAIQAIGRLRQAFPVHLELRELLDGTPTVAGIATLVAAQLPDAGQMDAMAALLAEVQSLSNDDIERQLTE